MLKIVYTYKGFNGIWEDSFLVCYIQGTFNGEVPGSSKAMEINQSCEDTLTQLLTRLARLLDCHVMVYIYPLIHAGRYTCLQS